MTSNGGVMSVSTMGVACLTFITKRKRPLAGGGGQSLELAPAGGERIWISLGLRARGARPERQDSYCMY